MSKAGVQHGSLQLRIPRLRVLRLAAATLQQLRSLPAMPTLLLPILFVHTPVEDVVHPLQYAYRQAC